MRFKAFLMESSDMSFPDLCDAISKECKRFLAEAGETPLYRGFKNSLAKKYPHPESRKPLDSGPAFNFMFNAGIQLAFDIPDIRERCIFATGDDVSASEYGDLCFIFPAGDCKFVWAPKIYDSVDDNQTLLVDIAMDLKSRVKTLADSTKTRLVNQLQSIFGGLRSVVRPSAWIKDDGSILKKENDNIPPGKFGPIQADNLQTELLTSMRNVFKDHYRTDNLGDAVRAHHEILFYETDGYYLVPLGYVRAQMVFDGIEKSHYSHEELFEYLMSNLKVPGHR